MPCGTIAIQYTGQPPPQISDKYYDCVNEECIEKIGGQYKNDPKCAGKCKPKDNTEMIIALGLAAVAAMALFGSKR